MDSPILLNIFSKFGSFLSITALSIPLFSEKSTEGSFLRCFYTHYLLLILSTEL